ncbi:MAG: mucoidy inhibitor MuiA family protein [Leptospirales bacterium]
MKKFSHLILIVAMISGIPVITPSIPAEKKILTIKTKPTEVTVYNDRALVTREKTLKLEKGSMFIQVTDLPLNLDSRSVRVSFNEGARVRLFYYDLKTNYLEENKEEEVEILRKQLDKLQQDRNALYARSRALDEKRKILTSIKIKSIKENNREIEVNKIDVSSWQSLLDFYYTSAVKIDDDKRRLKRAIKEIDEKKSAISKQISNYSGRKKGIKVLQVGLDSFVSANVTIKISYIMRHASWRPKYEIRTDNGREVELTYMGEIKQNTGESWNQVKLILSTARPAQGIKPPYLKTLTVDQYVSRYKKKKESSKGRSRYSEEADESPMMSGDSAGSGPAEREEEKPVTRVQKEFSSTTFHVRKPADIPSDGTGYSIPITTDKLSAKLEYNTVPMLSTAVFVQGEIRNRLNYPILPGPAALFVNNSYIGTTSLPRVAPKETFTLPFGPDEKFKVTRTKIKDFRQNSGLGKKTRISYHYRIEVENLRDDYITVEIRDRIPVSKNKNIKVEATKLSPEPEEANPTLPGILIWKIRIKPKQKQVIDIEYYIEYPQDMRIEYR